ncbi:MAG: ABC transporter substrate-binding protein, partial [Bacillota bacterium]
MRRPILVMGVAFLVIAGVSSLAAASAPIRIQVNGQYLTNMDVEPVNLNGRVFVPARFVAEALGASVEWDQESQTVIITSGSHLTSQGPGEIRLGFVGPMTGDLATFGVETKKGIELAIKQVNNEGGIFGKKLVLKIEDDRNEPAEAIQAVRRLSTQEKVAAVIGSVASKCTLAGAPIAQANRTVMISPTSTNERVTQVGEYVFRACFIDRYQGSALAQFARDSLKADTAACLFDATGDYPKSLAESFKTDFEKLGGMIVEYQTYNAGDQDFESQLTAIRTKKPDVLLLSDYYDTVGLIAKQARDLGLNSVFLGGDGWDSAELVRIAGKSIEGGYFVNHYSPDANTREAIAYREAFEKEYGSTPDALSALSYDATMLIIDAIRRAGRLEGPAIRDALSATRDFGAVSGSITIDPVTRNPVKSA